jgi:hypothetical protein
MSDLNELESQISCAECGWSPVTESQFWTEWALRTAGTTAKSTTIFVRESYKSLYEYVVDIDFIDQNDDGRPRISLPTDVVDEEARNAIDEAEEAFDPDDFERRWGGVRDGEYYCGEYHEGHY